MCWNKEVSLNTFLFSSFVLVLHRLERKMRQKYNKDNMFNLI